jgi:hypothetical protein
MIGKSVFAKEPGAGIEAEGRAEQAPGERLNTDLDLQLDEELKAALADFRSSVHAWSSAAYHRPRMALAAAPRKRVWRLAAGWALSCVLVAGAASGGLYEGLRERNHRQQLAKIAALQEAERQRLAAQRQAQEEEELLAKVDSDVSREVPSAMEPLAQLMAQDETR